MSNVQIVAYSENIFNISSDATEEQLKDMQVEVGINPLLRYKDGTDALGCQVRVVYTVDNKIVMEYGAIFTVMVAGWKELVNKNLDNSELIAATKAAWQEVLAFTRGAICVNARNKGSETIARLMLPSVDLDKFLMNVTMEKVE